jgi:prophage DNA circulation protein
MSIDSAFGAVRSITNTIERGVDTVIRTGADLGLGTVGGRAVYWKDALRPAQFRGLQFAVLTGEGYFGRKNVVHAYPYRDTVWAEDIGRAARIVNVTGFLVGDDVIAQRERMIAAAETPGTAELIHPTLGRLTVAMVAPMRCVEQWDKGRYFEIAFAFVEAGERQFPSVLTSTADAVKASCDAADFAAGSDFANKVGPALKQGAAVVQQAVNTAQRWARFAQKLSNDATNLYNLVGSLKGSFGRYSGGRRSGGLARKANAASSNVASVASLTARGAVVRQNVSSAIGKLSSDASGLGS